MKVIAISIVLLAFGSLSALAGDEPNMDVLVRTDDATGMVVFQGGNPRLMSGPAIEGVYAPDALYCKMPKTEGETVRSCTWGSSGQEDAPVVKLFRSKSH